jgi:hypothetical protein
MTPLTKHWRCCNGHGISMEAGSWLHHQSFGENTFEASMKEPSSRRLNNS